MASCASLFISYCHADEWLKNEFLSHLGALKRNGEISAWHDRLIDPGRRLDSEIDAAINSADIILLLVSSAFISSDYCMNKEYATARTRAARGDAEVIPILVRPCDWETSDLRSLLALPTDSVPVTTKSALKDEVAVRDEAWLNVVNGLKRVIKKVNNKLTPPSLSENYLEKLFLTDALKHPNLHEFNELAFFVDPDVFFENDKEQITSLNTFKERIKSNNINIVTGYDRSGKTLLAKKLQIELAKDGVPAVILNGSDIQNTDIQRYISSETKKQFNESTYPASKYYVIIDDFEDCILNDRSKEVIARYIFDNYTSIIIFSFSNAPSALFAPDDLPSPAIFNISQLNVGKIYKIVKLWKAADSVDATDDTIVDLFRKLQIIFDQTEVETSPYSILLFLNLLETSAGSDIAYSSFSSCYETLVLFRLKDAKVETGALDESKNFLAFVAYKAFTETGLGQLSRDTFEDCLSLFEERFLSDKKKLADAIVGSFLSKKNGTYYFNEEYIWYFMCARYVAKVLYKENKPEFADFVTKATQNIYLKKYANIVIFLGYHSDDNLVIEKLMDTVDGLFSKTNEWRLSDASRELMLGITPTDLKYIPESIDVEDRRIALLREKVDDIINNAEVVVAKYTLPFIHTRIQDSSRDAGIDPAILEIDNDAYMQSVNALFRAHSVIGHILGARAGTYSAQLILDCVTRMVQASGRYAALNHAIATILTFEKARSINDIKDALSVDEKKAEERYNKIKRIFSFWCVYMSQAGLARYLCQEHTIRALNRLVDQYEAEKIGDHIPFNFTSVQIISKLYKTGKIDHNYIETILDKYGEKSALVALLRVAYHIYAYYMPLSIQDKQWLSSKLSIPMKKIEAQRLKSTAIKLMHQDGTPTTSNKR